MNKRWILWLVVTFCLVIPVASSAQDVPAGNHYLCYRAKDTAKPPQDPGFVELTDQFESFAFYDPKPARLFCNPASKAKLGEVLLPPLDPHTHLKVYPVTRVSPVPPPDPVEVEVTDQFGTLRLETLRLVGLRVPTSKSLAPPFPPLPDPALLPEYEHYTCYTFKLLSKFAPVTVVVDDQFLPSPLTVTVTRPIRLCTPADKNTELRRRPERHLMCYRLDHFLIPISPVFVTNQFTHEKLALSPGRQLCVPAAKEVVEEVAEAAPLDEEDAED